MEILEKSQGRWVLPWDEYPKNMLAVLLEAYANGYASEPVDKSTVYSLKIRLQKMCSAIRDQESPKDVDLAAEHVYWTIEPAQEGLYKLIGGRRTVKQPRPEVLAPDMGTKALQSILSDATGGKDE